MKGGKDYYLAQHGLIILIVLGALEILHNPISWNDFIDMDREDLLETQIEPLLELEGEVT